MGGGKEGRPAEWKADGSRPMGSFEDTGRGMVRKGERGRGVKEEFTERHCVPCALSNGQHIRGASTEGSGMRITAFGAVIELARRGAVNRMASYVVCTAVSLVGRGSEANTESDCCCKVAYRGCRWQRKARTQQERGQPMQGERCEGRPGERNAPNGRSQRMCVSAGVSSAMRDTCSWCCSDACDGDLLVTRADEVRLDGTM